MKKLLSLCFLSLLSLVLLSWGSLGHQIVGLIAVRHLTPKAKAAIQYYLGSLSLEEISTWADEVRSNPSYRHTASWHFLNLPLGLSYNEFQQQVKNMGQDNVYKALLDSEQKLTSPTTTKEEKIEALKFIVHFVGDLHQPMHISRKEDKGGNTIQVNYEGKGTNLHSLWDSRLLEHQGRSVEELANQIDRATPQQIKQWQSEPVMQWLWESYQISSQLYKEVEGMNKRTISDSYYQQHIPIVDQRLEQAGIRLAGLLNTLFQSANLTASTPVSNSNSNTIQPSTTVKQININEVSKHIGEKVSICSMVYGSKSFSNMTLLNLGADYPNQLLTVVLKEEAMQVHKGLEGKSVCVTGELINYKGKPEIIVTDPYLLKINTKGY